MLLLWSADFRAIGKTFDMDPVWAEMASDLRAVLIEQCGHLPHEEEPEVINRLLVNLLEDETDEALNPSRSHGRRRSRALHDVDSTS
jgi:hypothetical protein